jgi:predicted polyphosphate/ATP-dependent NAD kinase
MERFGIIINPKAGGGISGGIVRDVLERLGPRVIYAGPNEIEFLRASKFKVFKIEIERKNTFEDTLALVERFNELELDAVIVFGGDGTMSDASFSIHPLLCIPTGTTNVSPLIFNDSTTFSIDEIKPERLVRRKMGGLVVRVDELSFKAFNDVVVGSTILATLKGKQAQIDAELFLQGKKVESKPRKFKVRIEIAKGRKILKTLSGVFGNVFISPTSERYLGKGIAGGAAASTLANFKGVVACTNEGMIYRYSKEELREVEPFVTASLSFDEGEIVRIFANEVVSRDGTPIKKAEYAEVEYQRNLVEVLKLG